MPNHQDCFVAVLAVCFLSMLLPVSCHARDTTAVEYDVAIPTTAGLTSMNGSPGTSSFNDGVLKCDFSGKPGYVGVNMGPAPILGHPQKLTLTLDSDASGHPLVLRFVDSDNQYFQAKVADLDSPGVRMVSLPVNDMSQWFHFGGKNDGEVRLPIKLAEIIVDHDGPDASIRLMSLKVRTEIPLEQGISFSMGPRTQESAADTIVIETKSILPGAVGARYEWTEKSFDGRVLDSGREQFVLESGKVVQRSLKVAKDGVRLCEFRLDADLAVGDLNNPPLPLKTRAMNQTIEQPEFVTVSKTIATSVVKAPTGGSSKLLPDSEFGMGIYLGQRWQSADQELPAEIARDIGVKWMRDEFNWGHLEPEKGKWNWDRFDHSVETATKNGISIFGLLCYWAPWTKPHTPEGIADYCNYVRTVVGRYKGCVKYWEIWNEPNIFFWTGTVEQYAELMKAAYSAVKEADPEAMVIGCCTSGTDLRFIEKVFQNGGYDNMDILSIHPYRYPPTPEESDFIGELKRADALVRKYGPRKEIWLTEIGWPTNAGDNGSSEAKQAAMIARTYMQAAASGVVQKVFWYNFRNDGLDPSYNEHNFGIIRRDQSLKPACEAFMTMTRHLEGKKFVKALNPGQGVYAYLFEGGGKRTLAAWCTAGSARLKVSGRPAQVVDLIGGAVSVKNTAAGFSFPISEYPVFISDVDKNVIVNADIIESKPLIGDESDVRIDITPAGPKSFAVSVTSPRPLNTPGDVIVRADGYADRFTIPKGTTVHSEKYQLPQSLSMDQSKGLTVSASVDIGQETVTHRSIVYYVESRHAPEGTKLGDDLAKWKLGAPITMGRSIQDGADAGKWGGPDDLSGNVWTSWDSHNFYVIAEIQDDVMCQTHDGADIWQGDSLQFALDPLHLESEGPGATYEIGLALTPKGPQVFSWLAPSGIKTGLMKNARLMVKRSGVKTIYQAAIPLADLAPLKPKAVKTVGFALVLNDDDGTGRKSWLKWNSGIALEKTPYTFGDITFTGGAVE